MRKKKKSEKLELEELMGKFNELKRLYKRIDELIDPPPPYKVTDKRLIEKTRNKYFIGQGYHCALSGSLDAVLNLVHATIRTTNHEPADIIILRGDVAFHQGVKWNIDPKRWYLYYIKDLELH